MDLYLIDYDGINLFKDGKWTGIVFGSFNEAKLTLDFLRSLNNSQIDKWIELKSPTKNNLDRA